MQPFPQTHKPRRRALALLLVLGAVMVLFAATAVTSQAFVTKTGHDTADDFAPGRFGRTGLLTLPDGTESVHLLPIGLFGDWVEGRSLPRKLSQLSAVAAGGHIVVMGGVDDNGQYPTEVWVSTIGTDGSLGPWISQTYTLPHGVSGAAAVAYPKDEESSWIYLIGGNGPDGLGGTDIYSDVLYTTLNHSTGTTGEWTATTPLSMPLRFLGAVALDGHIYVVGGNYPYLPRPDKGPQRTVYYAQINPTDGSLGAWQETSPLPIPLNKHLLVTYENKDVGLKSLYAIGGKTRLPGNDATEVPTLTVYFADVNPDGSLITWTQSGGVLPRQLYAHHGVQFREQILATGGVDAEASTALTTVLTSTVRAALIDPTNDSWRLYDWGGTVGAWATGPLLPAPRAWHQTVAEGHFVYTLGGVDEAGNILDSVYWGKVDDPGARYAPTGYYESPVIDLKSGVRVHQLEWGATITAPAEMTMTMRYQYKPQNGDWQTGWSTARNSHDGVNTWQFEPPLENVRLFKYRVDMGTAITNESPLLDWVDVYYEVDDPELSVRKDTGMVITAELDSYLDYTIYYTNSGAWVAENAVLTETLPANTSYVGSGWNRVGSSNVYTYALGDVAKYATGSALFQIKIDATVPQGMTTVDNAVAIGYPPMRDELDQIITDPDLDNNYYEWSNPLNRFAIAIAKGADPASGSTVFPAQRIEYTLYYSNTGQNPLTNVVLQDSLPVSVTYVADSIWPAAQGDDSDPQNLTWNIGDLAAGASGTVGFAVRVKQDAPEGASLANSATARADRAKTKTSNTVWHSVGEAPVSTLEVLKSADPASGSTVSPGDLITYTLSYQNNGTAPLTDLKLTDLLPDNVTYVAGSIWPAAQGDDSNPDELQWTIGVLDPGVQGTAGFSVRVDDSVPGGLLLMNGFTAEMNELGPQQSNSVFHVTHVEAPDLTVVSIEAVPPEPNVGEPFDLIVTVRNQGSQDADDGEFWVEVYLKPYPATWPQGPDDHEGGYCSDASCTGPLRGEYVMYTTSLAAGQEFPFRFKNLSLPSGGIYQVFAQADICFVGYYCRDPRWGWYLEQNENNNIRMIYMQGSVVNLILIERGY